MPISLWRPAGNKDILRGMTRPKMSLTALMLFLASGLRAQTVVATPGLRIVPIVPIIQTPSVGIGMTGAALLPQALTLTAVLPPSAISPVPAPVVQAAESVLRQVPAASARRSAAGALETVQNLTESLSRPDARPQAQTLSEAFDARGPRRFPLSIDFGHAPTTGRAGLPKPRAADAAADENERTPAHAALKTLERLAQDVETRLNALSPDDFDAIAAKTAKPGDSFYAPPEPAVANPGEILRSYNHYLTPAVDAQVLKPYNAYYNNGVAHSDSGKHSDKVAELLKEPRNRWFYMRGGGGQTTIEALRKQHDELQRRIRLEMERAESAGPADPPARHDGANPVHHRNLNGGSSLWETVSPGFRTFGPGQQRRADYLRRRGF